MTTPKSADDLIFRHITEDNPHFGRVLDAGTGMHSFQWLSEISSAESITAVTASDSFQKQVQQKAATLGIANRTTVVLGNWFVPTQYPITKDAVFDTIIADYLIGSMDGFSPYRQDEMIPLLLHHLTPTGRLYIVGLEPVPTDSSTLVSRVYQTRDACILLAGHRCYREYPLNWIEKQVNKAGAVTESTQQFPIVHSAVSLEKQVQVGRSKLPLLPAAVADGMREHLDELSQEVQDKTPLKVGFDYVVVVRKGNDECGETEKS